MAIPTGAEAIKSWRRETRKAFLGRRMGFRGEDREEANASVMLNLLEAFGLLQGMTVGFYDPIRGEVDPRFAVHRMWRQGTIAALPVVVRKGAPLQFREWFPDVRMKAGVFGLREPEDGRPLVPQALLMPPVAFDEQGYRLGYGGGYFDRTLAALHPQPLKIGLAFELSRIGTIHPQPHDVPMDFVVTEAGVYYRLHDSLEKARDCADAARHAHHILRDRIAGRDGNRPSTGLAALREAAGQYASPPCYAHEVDPYYWDQ